jgi:hypothetical protein
MNERIKELIEQSTTIEEYGWGASYANFDREKFAELIVQECADKVDWILAEGGKTQGDLLREHFGVKE